ncbi:MAG: MBL fold metallo-hydrolase [Rhodospirillaceae bacterium]|nr:MBL fold metallo-hydrolase [Rhodospirillaceae bacterium]
MPSRNQSLELRGETLSTAIAALALLFGHAALAQTPIDPSLTETVETVRITASGQRFVPRQSLTPGGAPRHTANYDVTVTWNPGAWQAREEWQLDTVYPLQTSFAYSMTYGELAGVKDGQDNFRAPLDGPTPLAAARIGANFKDLWLTNPLILAAHSEAALPPVEFASGGNARQRIVLSAHGTEWTLVVDPSTGLPEAVIVMEQDPLNGEGSNRVEFSDWREVAGVPFPFQVEQYLNGGLLRREIRSVIEVNPADADSVLTVPDGIEAGNAAHRDWGWGISHLLLARAGLGGPADTPHFDNVEFLEVGPDIYQIVGGSHHGLAVVGPSGIAVVDAPWYPERSDTLLRLLEERWPDRPVRYIIMTHHHLDHSGGFRSFVEAGATLVAHEDAVWFYEEALALAGFRGMSAVAVDGHADLDGIGRAIGVYDIPNPHADAHVGAYVPDTRLFFNSDLYSPGRELQFPVSMQALFTAVRYHGLDVERHVGSHGMGYDSEPE